MPWLIKQLIKAEKCLTRKDAQKVLKKAERLNGKHYIKPKSKNATS